MGYHVTILRTKSGAQESISQKEVEVAVASIPGLIIKKITEPPWKGCLEISVRSPDNDKPALLWQDGEIWTKNPDDKTMQVMLNLAKKLNARVRGDEFETYKTPNESYQHPDDLTLIHSAS